jgi:hypothetical protein
MPVKAVDAKNRRAIRLFKQQIDKDKGLICFSKTWTNPVLWGHYGDKHKGIALGFDVTKEVANQVIYSNSLISIPVNPISNKAAPTAKLVDNILRTKFKDWRYENEWRVFFDLKDEVEEVGMFFAQLNKDIQLKEIILGPNCTATVAKVLSILKDYGDEVQVMKSRIAFNSFRVVKDLSVPNATNKKS